MTRKKVGDRIEELLRDDRWDDARLRIEEELRKDPTNHWLITQLGVTLYETRDYRAALERFIESLEIVEDCPLTLWNLAGTLDAIGEHSKAIRIYEWVVRSNKSPRDDPCWESREWTDSLKLDCLYRMGVCAQHLGKKPLAAQYYQIFQNVLLNGRVQSIYSIAEVESRLRSLSSPGRPWMTNKQVREVFRTTPSTTGLGQGEPSGDDPPKWILKLKGLSLPRRSTSNR